MFNFSISTFAFVSVSRRLSQNLLAASINAKVLSSPGNDGLVVVWVVPLGVGEDLPLKLPYIIQGRKDSHGAKEIRVLVNGHPDHPLTYRYRA